MASIGRELNSEEQSVLLVLTQAGRPAQDRTALGVAMALERDVVDVASVLERLERDGLASRSGDTERGVCWRPLVD